MEQEEIKQEEDSLFVSNPKQVAKTYSSVTLIANALIATSATGLSVVGVLMDRDLKYVLGFMIILSIVGWVGRFVKEDVELMEKGSPTGFKAVSIRFFEWTDAKLRAMFARLRSYF